MINTRQFRAMSIVIGCIVMVSLLGNTSVVSVRAEPSGQIASTPVTAYPVVVYYFWGDGCPHCAATWVYWGEIGREYPNMEVQGYEVWYNEGNQQLFLKMAAEWGFEPSAVPTIFIGDRHWVGSSEQIHNEMRQVIDTCSRSGCIDAGAGIIPGVPVPSGTAEPAVANPEDGTETDPAPGSTQILSIPLIGEVDLSTQSLALSTALIAFVDGFNPCSLWALSVLLALTIHTGSRRRVFLVGIVFLTVTSLIYMLFITGLFTMFTVVNFIGWIQVVAALAAFFFAVVNIKDYFWYKKGISFTIADKNKPGIYAGMRRVMNAGESTWAVIGATVVLSAGVSLVEFSCTAGFPVLWTNLLISQGATVMTFVALILLYMVIYQIDELAIFSVAVLTLKAGRFEEKHGRLLKLAGGMLMLTLAVVMLVNPSWMNQIGTSLLVFLIALGLTALVLVIHRTILPRFGVYVGSELAAVTSKKGSHRHGKHHHD
jgi:glutaredoxin